MDIALPPSFSTLYPRLILLLHLAPGHRYPYQPDPYGYGAYGAYPYGYGAYPYAYGGYYPAYPYPAGGDP